MSQIITLEDVYKKLKESPHWREDFKIEEVSDSGGITAYYIKA